MPLILIDASGWLFRAYHALPPLTDPQGEPTGAVFGMLSMLQRLQKDYPKATIVVIFDAPGPTFRDEIYAEYKANRDATPEDLKSQFPKIVELVEALGLPLVAVPGVEADDVVGSYARAAEAAGDEVMIVTRDKDLAQLVTPRVTLFDTMKQRHLDPAGVAEKYGVPPERIVDYLMLIGDTSDNIPGVPLVGPKTAARWLQEYGSLDAIVAGAAELPGKAGSNLRDCIGQFPMTRELATIRVDVPLPRALDALEPRAANKDHLAALYRRWGFRRQLDALLGRVPETPATPAVRGAGPGALVAPSDAAAPPLAQTTCVRDEAGLATLVEALSSAGLICVDTETDSLDAVRARLVGLSFAVEPGHAWYVPVGHDYAGAPAQLPLARVKERLGPLLADPARPKLGQNLKYDLNVLVHNGFQLAGIAHDTLLESYVLDAAGNRHDMDSMAERYLHYRTIRFEDVAGKGRAQLSFNQVPVERAAPYSGEDADITLRLHRHLYPALNKVEALARVYRDIEMPLLPVLAKMERDGVKVDADLLGHISGELAERMEVLQRQAWQAAGSEFNLGSPKQLQTILYDQLALPVLGKTPKGDPSTAESVLEELALQHPLPRLILDWRSLAKLRSTYADNLPRQINPETGRIHTNYHQAVAATGRLSSSDPNLQNIPARTAEGRRIRQAFIAEAGNALLSIDYSQIELRLVAHLSGDVRLQEAFHRRLDVHRATAAEVAGIASEDVTPEQRRAAKVVNFGLIYGMSAFGLARQLGIPRGAAQDYIDRFFARYTGVQRYIEATRLQARQRGYVETLYGRRLYLPDIRARNSARRQYAERTAINAPLQGTAADLIKRAMLDLAQWLRGNAPRLRMILQVHDELVFEGPKAELMVQGPVIARRMCTIRSLHVPLAAEWGVADNWDAAHSISQGVVSSAD